MKAWVLHNINEIQLEEVRKPEIQDDEVLISVKAAGVCGSDIPRIYENGAHNMPLIPGHEFAGEVAAIGKNVKREWKGKRVGIFPLIPCKNCLLCRQFKYEMCKQYSYLGSRQDGGFAEYVAVPEWNLIELPDNVSFEAAAMLEPMAVAVHAIKRINPGKTDTVIVEGLGTIGQLITIFLLEMGIRNILVIGNKDFQKQSVMQLGIPEENYCDSREEKVKDWILYHTDKNGADYLFECAGRNETIALAIDGTSPGGSVCMVGNPFTDMVLERDIYWKILRHQLNVTGSWNSSYKGVDADDWKYVVDKLKQEAISPEKLITHQLELEDLNQGLHIMRDKTQDYIKVMITM